MLSLVMVFAAAAFTLSACVGLGGSLILVPALSLLLGAKSGVVLSGLLLAANNVGKVIAYRRALPLQPIAGVLIATMAGAFIGARLLVIAPVSWVSAAVLAAIALSFMTEQAGPERLPRVSPWMLALGAGLTSGFAGTSGPLKGLAIRGLTTDRQHLAGAASAVSLAADLVKAAVYLQAALLDEDLLAIGAAGVMLVPFTATLGYRLNQGIGERAFRLVFWSVMLGYSVRLIGMMMPVR